MMRRASPVLAALVLAALGGCGGRAFQPQFEPPPDPSASNVLAELTEPVPREARPVMVAVTEDPTRLLAWDLAEGEQLWAIETRAASAPIVAGTLVVTHEGEAVVGRELQTGEVAFEVGDDETRLVGADGNEEYAVVALARGPEENPRGTLIGVQGNDHRWTEKLALPVGVPALHGSAVVVPWATQRLSVLDAATGQERARVHMRDGVLGHAFVHDGVLYAGQHEVYRVEPTLENAKRQGRHYEPARRQLPAQPTLLRDGYTPAPAPDGAWHRVRLLWSPELSEQGTIGLQDESLYFVFYSLLFGLEPDEDALRWVYDHPRDVVGGAAHDGGVLLADAAGRLAFVSARTGRKTWDAEVGVALVEATFRPASMPAPGDEPADAEPPELQRRLYDVAQLDDQRIGAGRALAIRYLGHFEDDDVTGQLVELCANRDDEAQVRRAACDAVAERSTGRRHIREALRARASFLEDTPPPPVGALARAAANMKLRAAVPSLLEHLQSPATPTEELPGLFQALGALGDKRSTDPLGAFVRTYHADGDDPALAEAVTAAADALMRLDEDRARELLAKLSTDPLAPEGMRRRLRSALSSGDAGSDESKEAQGEPDAKARTGRAPSRAPAKGATQP